MEPYLCEAVLRFSFDGEEPPVYCDEEALPGSDYCAEHDPDLLQDAAEGFQ